MTTLQLEGIDENFHNQIKQIAEAENRSVSQQIVYLVKGYLAVKEKKLDSLIFLTEEYRTLRKEIEETKSRIFRLAALSAAGMPSSYFLAQKNTIEIFTMFLPLLIFAVMMLYLAESRALMRCGKYIKDFIEPFQPELKTNISGQGNKTKEIIWKGWENWLEEDDLPQAPLIKNTKRSVDRFAAFFFYTFFTIHYVASVFLSIDAFYKKFNNAGYYCSATAWVLIGLGVLFYLAVIFGRSTSTRV